MASRELLAFAEFIRSRIGVTPTSNPPLQGMLDAYGLTGAEREAMISQLHEIGAVQAMHIGAPLLVEKLPKE